MKHFFTEYLVADMRAFKTKKLRMEGFQEATINTQNWGESVSEKTM